MAELNTQFKHQPSSCNCGVRSCVIFPSAKCLKCDPITSETSEICEPGSEQKYITKLFFEEDNMNNEIEKYKELKLEAIDPEMNFFISKPIVCDSLTLDNIKDKVSKCKDKDKVKFKEFNPFYGINFIYGGESLTRLYLYEKPRQDRTFEEYKKLLLALKNIFEGVKLLHSNHIYHMDLKLDNIVIDFNQPNPICKIIDFGETINLDLDLTKNLIETIGSLSYMAPEMALNSYDGWNILFFGKNERTINNVNDNQILESIVDQIETNNFIEDNNIFKLLSIYELKIDKIQEDSKIKIFFNKEKFMSNTINDLITYVKEILRDKSKEESKEKKFYNKYIKYIKGDIWALGIILLIFYSLIDTDIQEDDSQKKSILDNLFRVIDKLLTINPYERPNADEALELYNTFLISIQQSDVVGGFINKKTKKTKYTKNSKKSKKSKKSNKLNKSKIHKTYKRNKTNKGGFLGKSRTKSSFLGKSRAKNNLR